MEFQDDPFAKYGGTEVKASDGDPFAKYGGSEVKDSHKSNIPTTLQISQQPSELTPILPQHRDEYKQQQQAKAQAVTDHFKNIRAELPKESQDSWDRAVNIATGQQSPTVSATPENEQSHHALMDMIDNKSQPIESYVGGQVLKSLAYLGSKSTKGTLQVAKGAAYLADLGANPTSLITGENAAIKKGFDKANTFADFGLTKGDQAHIGDNPIMNNLGGLAEFLPAAAAASGTGGATLYLQGIGQGKDAIDQVEKSGAQINPIVKNAFILGTGAVNGYLMGDLGNSIFKSLPSGLKGDITASITADAIKQASGKELTGEAFKDLLDKGAKDFGDKLAKGGIATLEGYKHAVTNLSALAGANFTLKKGADVANDAPVFNEHLGDLASNLNDIATKQAPFFAIPSAIGAASKLTPYSDYKNSVVENLMHDNSPENVEKTKQDIADYGHQNGWRTEDVEATIDHVGKIADIAKSLPKNLPENKLTDAVDLVQGRNKLQSELDEARKAVDPALQDHLSPNEQLITDKIEQANDKLRALVTGNKLTVSKGTGDDEGNFYKTIGGKQEPIEESRYKLDALERDSKTNNSSITQTENESTNEKGSQEKSGTSSEESGQKENAVPAEEKVVSSGADKSVPETIEPITENNDTTNTPTGTADNRNGAESPASEVQPKPVTETKGEKEATGIRNADVEIERGEAIPRDKMSKQAIEAEGKRLVDSGDVDPDELAKQVISSKKPITAEEQAALLYHKVKLKNRQREILKDEAPENVTENQIEYAKNEDLLAKNQEATEIAGNVTGRALGFRTETMNEDYSRNSVFRRAKLANNGVELDPKDKSALEEKTKRIDELENKLLDREEQIRKLHDQTTISKVKRTAELQEREAKRDITKASLRKEREGILAELHLIAKKSLGEAGANKIPVDMLAPLAKLARNYVLDGAVSISSVVDKLYNDLKDHIEGLDKKDLTEVVKENFEKYLAEQNQVRLDRSKKLQSKKLQDVKNQLETGNYEKKIQRKIQVDNDYLKIRAEINRQQLLINKKIEEIAHSNRSLGRKAVDFAVKWGRNAKLASITVLGKLAATGLTTMGLKAVTEGIGAGISKVLPKIAATSTVEGGISVKGLAKSYAKAVTEGMKDAYNELNIKKGGQSDLSALYGKYTLGRLPAEAADFFGHLHSAIKAPIKRQAWEYSYAKRMAKGIQQGIDVQDPIIDAKNRLDAYKDAERAIFMGDNLISKGYEASMKTLENSASGSAKNIAALTRILLPFVKVPTNIALSTGRYAFGSVMGLGKLAQIGTSSALKTVGAETMAKVIHSGMGGLTPEESDTILRNLKHGSVGAAALLIGFYNPKNVGGFYQEHEKRKKNDANVGSLKVFGHKIPVFLTEHPIFQAMQIGATFRRVLDAHRHKEDKVSAAALATASGLAEGIPLAKEAKQITDMFGSDTHKLNTFISNAVKGEIEPALIQQIAIATDTKNGDTFTFDDKNQNKREPNKKKGLWKYFKQDLATGIPGARETVKIKH